jgi:hypothetical protein
MLYPLNVEVNEKNINAIVRTFKDSYKDIVNEIATATDFGVANRKAILAQIEKTLIDLGQDVDEFLKKELPGYYKQGVNQAVTQLNNLGADVGISTGFNKLHKEAIFALVDDTNIYVNEALSNIKRSATTMLNKVVREQVTQNIAKGMIAGDALQTAIKDIKQTLIDEGLTALTDSAGKTWDLDTYAEMLFRTMSVQARNRGLANRMVENGYDLVQVSDHNADCDLCSPWEGKILSISGDDPEYDTVAEAEADGLFHPNCKHAINVLIPKLAKQTNSYGTGKE